MSGKCPSSERGQGHSGEGEGVPWRSAGTSSLRTLKTRPRSQGGEVLGMGRLTSPRFWKALSGCCMEDKQDGERGEWRPGVQGGTQRGQGRHGS